MAPNGLFQKEKGQKKEAFLNYMLTDLGMDLNQTISLPRVFLRTASIYGSNIALMERREGKYQGITFSQVKEKSSAFAAALIEFGFAPQSRVALLLKNSPAWVYSDFGTMFAGCVTVPLYYTLNAAAIEFILRDSGASAIVVEDDECLQRIRPIKDGLRDLKLIIVRKPEGIQSESNVRSFEEYISGGEAILNSQREDLAKRLEGIKRDDLASIIYTSGTTGNPKGVMLTHRNFLSNLYGIMSVTDIDENDTFLSILPLSHAFERTTGYYCPLMCGARIAYAEGIKGFDRNLREVEPTVCCVVPIILEKIYDKICEGVKKSTKLQQKIFKWALRVGEKVMHHIDECAEPDFTSRRRRHRPQLRKDEQRLFRFIHAPIDFTAHFIANALVYRKIRKVMGGRLRHFVTGGAPMARHVIDFFSNLNVAIYEGYGMTETSPVISFNYSGAFKAGTTGKLLPYVQLKFSPEGELLVKGPNVTSGYYKNPEATSEAIEADGWLHTGDLGMWDENNYLKITGRIKELIVLSTGKKVAPIPIENKLKQNPVISQAVVLGNDRKFITALIFPDEANVRALARMKGIVDEDIGEICRHADIRKEFSDIVKRVNDEFSQYEQVKCFEIIPYNIDGDSEIMTPTLKVKRKVIENKFGDVIDKMYE